MACPPDGGSPPAPAERVSLLDDPRAFRWASRHLLCRVEDAPDRFAISFDDGPSPTNTPRMIETLRALSVRATFFLLGVHAARHPAIARRLADEGHEIGLHGHHHLPAALIPRWLRMRELETARRIVHEITGAVPRLFRAPYGLLTPGQAADLRSAGFEPVLGEVYPGDHARPAAERIAARALARLRPGSILILHDASAIGDWDRGPTIEAVGTIVRGMRARGIEPVPVGTLAARAPGRSLRAPEAAC